MDQGRYIGVGMVAGAIFLVLLIWLWYSGWLMNILSRSQWRRWRRKRPDNTGENSKDALVHLSARAHLEKPKRVHIKDAEGVLGEVEQDELQSKSERELGYASRCQPLERARLRG
ncbi:hypothetical protein F5887DRAFT_914026 [Amanita rubescens]|nr:hypothetical protein F5887DRAFT_914026 [Amanita rubescens]